MSESRAFVVIGAGIVGLSASLCLQDKGFEVTIIDRDLPGTGCSFGNAGLLARYYIEPVPLPGLLTRLPAMLMDRRAPMIVRWRHLPRLSPWLLRLLLSSRRSRAEEISKALASLQDKDDSAYREFLKQAGIENLIRSRGVLIAFMTEKGMLGVRDVFELYRRRGIPFEILDSKAACQLVPELSDKVKAAAYFRNCSHLLDPYATCRGLGEQFCRNGGIIERANVLDIKCLGDESFLILTDKKTYTAKGLVLAAGAFSGRLARRLGCRIPLESERGYHVTLPAPGVQLDVPVMSGEVGFCINQMTNGQLRIAGTVELASLQALPDYTRADLLLQKAKEILPKLSSANPSRWIGFRPSLPDSLPVIGRSPILKGAYLGFGHGHLGMTLGPVTGRLISELASNQVPSVDLSPFRPDRFNSFF
ncbi:MAG TPA: FAD-dependent oxidoreductase [Chthoniobacterales bacterium]|nr:FAD-dependent oxidoreductase [Chthoniobacterales bacterium]